MKNKKYILTHEAFRALFDDEDVLKDFLNSILHLEGNHSIDNLTYQFEKMVDVFLPGNEPFKLDAFVSTKDKHFINIELQNYSHPFLIDRIILYNAYLLLRGKKDYNDSDFFKNLQGKPQKRRYYELPDTYSIWLCNFPILKKQNHYRDFWAIYSENEIKNGKIHPIFSKNKYLIIDLPKFIKANKTGTREETWLNLLSQGTFRPKDNDFILEKAIDRLRDFYELERKEDKMGDYYAMMSHIADLELKAEARGKARGMAKGMEKGMAKGMAEGKNLMAEFLKSKGVSKQLIKEALAYKGKTNIKD